VCNKFENYRNMPYMNIIENVLCGHMLDLSVTSRYLCCHILKMFCVDTCLTLSVTSRYLCCHILKTKVMHLNLI